MRRFVDLALVLALLSGACGQPDEESAANRITTPTSSRQAPTTAPDPRYWCPGLGYCDFAEPSRDALWPRTYTGRVVSHDPNRSEILPLTFRIHMVDAAYDLPARTGERDELPEW